MDTFTDILALTWRGLIHYIRLPQLLVFSTVQPVMFVLLFAYVFGGAIKVQQGGTYINYLMPGILVQSAVFGAVQTGVGIADDLSKGLVERFASLPMSRLAPVAGRTLADMIRNIFVVLLMIAVGYLIGFRFQNGFINAALAISIIILFGFAFSWISANIGLLVKEAETAQVAGFIWVFPLVFASSIFVPIETMPNWLQAFANVNPITISVDLVRSLVLGGQTLDQLINFLLWVDGILTVFVPLTLYRYKRRMS